MGGVAPRADLNSFARQNSKIPHFDDLPVWTVWCFRTRAGNRGRGIAHVPSPGRSTSPVHTVPRDRGLSGRQPWRTRGSDDGVRRDTGVVRTSRIHQSIRHRLGARRTPSRADAPQPGVSEFGVHPPRSFRSARNIVDLLERPGDAAGRRSHESESSFALGWLPTGCGPTCQDVREDIRSSDSGCDADWSSVSAITTSVIRADPRPRLDRSRPAGQNEKQGRSAKYPLREPVRSSRHRTRHLSCRCRSRRLHSTHPPTQLEPVTIGS